MQGNLSEVVLILVGSTVIILFLIGFVVFALFLSQKRKFLYRQELIELKYANEREILRTQIETQVQTFQTISQELHDNVGNLVSIAIVHLKTAMGRTGNNEEAKNLRESGELLEEALDILRDISRSINPDNVSRQGLDTSFKNELERLRKTRVFTTEYSSEGSEFQVPAEHQMVILRIFQETLNNIIKHSGGNRVSVWVRFADPLVEFIIEDNGKGFDLKMTENSASRSGLLNMRRRAKIMDASLSIDSQPGKGTRVKLAYTKDPKSQESGISLVA